jgi:hypothetical protein
MKKRHVIKTILALCLFFVAGCIGRYFQMRYYAQEYEPIQITQQVIADFPDEYFIKGLTCISHNKSYCNSTVLEMIGLLHGIDQPVHYYNWLTGLTYGAATFAPDYFARYFPMVDPEPGSRIAAPYLGLKRNYYVTKNRELYIQAAKSYLSQNFPLRIAVDTAVYRGSGESLPHAILVVGYSDSTVYYYETGRGMERKIPDYPGESMSWETLVASVEGFHSMFSLPWTYNFTVYTKGETETDPVKVWERNASNIIGYDYTSVSGGSMALLKVIDELQGRELTDSDKDQLKAKLEISVYTRADNSAFIKENFQDGQLQQVADLLQEASDAYAAINVDDKAAVIAGLQKCAGLEVQIGTAMNTYCVSVKSK